MLRRFSFLSMLVLVFCLWSTQMRAADACSPTNTTSRSSTKVLIPRVGTPQTPDSGVADGWVLAYKDSEHKQLSHEVLCRDNKIYLAASPGDEKFQESPDCTLASCTRSLKAEYPL